MRLEIVGPALEEDGEGTWADGDGSGAAGDGWAGWRGVGKELRVVAVWSWRWRENRT